MTGVQTCALPIFIILFIVFAYSVVSVLNDYSIINIGSSARSLLVLPLFFLAGYSIKFSNNFRKFLDFYFGKLLLFVAIIGIAEYLLDVLVGTKTFWIDVVDLEKYFCDIKGQSNRMVFGLPGNFYGAYGKEYFSQKRLVSFFVS